MYYRWIDGNGQEQGEYMDECPNLPLDAHLHLQATLPVNVWEAGVLAALACLHRHVQFDDVQISAELLHHCMYDWIKPQERVCEQAEATYRNSQTGGWKLWYWLTYSPVYTHQLIDRALERLVQVGWLSQNEDLDVDTMFSLTPQARRLLA